jgi:uncharacterized iron-regulated protein
MEIGRTSLLPMVAASVLAYAMAAGERAESAPGECVPVGEWVSPTTGETVSHQDLVADIVERSVVLLGELHAEAEHHRWELQVVASLYAVRQNLVLGFEAFPRHLQPVLDRWVAGELDTGPFLDEVDWDRTWGTDPGLYLPLFHFARMNRIRMVALDVERSLVTRVQDEGWEQVPEGEREGISDPAPAPQPYVDGLAAAYREHLERGVLPGDVEREIEPDDPEFRRFVRAQLFRDRAMAEAIDTARQESGQPLVLAIVGRGHLEHRMGVPWQLAALGFRDGAVLIPWDRERDCAEFSADIADAAFGIDAPPDRVRTKQRLGVRIAMADDGARVVGVLEGSIAETAGLREDDVIVEAAGTPVARASNLIAVVQRQAPGTWLPLKVTRDGQTLDIIAKFPSPE